MRQAEKVIGKRSGYEKEQYQKYESQCRGPAGAE